MDLIYFKTNNFNESGIFKAPAIPTKIGESYSSGTYANVIWPKLLKFDYPQQLSHLKSFAWS